MKELVLQCFLQRIATRPVSVLVATHFTVSGATRPDGNYRVFVATKSRSWLDTFIRLMRLISYISAHPNEIPGVTFPPDPAMIIICPTKTLEEEMVRFISFWKNKGTHLNFPGGKNEKMWPPIIGHQFRYHQNGETIQESRFVSGCTKGSHDDSPITGATEVEVV